MAPDQGQVGARGSLRQDHMDLGGCCEPLETVELEGGNPPDRRTRCTRGQDYLRPLLFGERTVVRDDHAPSQSLPSAGVELGTQTAAADPGQDLRGGVDALRGNRPRLGRQG